jgi:tetratricopeptide (TPR) repeat protein
MPRSQRNDNFIDKTFTVVADILIKVLPTKSFYLLSRWYVGSSWGWVCWSASKLLPSSKIEIDPYDRSYILYNIGLIHTSNGKHGRALEYYYQALKRNPSLPQALNNIAVIYHYRAEQATENINRKLLNYYMIKLRIIGTKQYD